MEMSPSYEAASSPGTYGISHHSGNRKRYCRVYLGLFLEAD
jgi:hypothetical protein